MSTLSNDRAPAQNRLSDILTFENVVVLRGGRRVLDDVSFKVPERTVTVIAGPSGVGKTTVLRLANRLDIPDTGLIRYRGNDVSTLEPTALRRRVGMVFQAPVMFAGTVMDNLAVAEPDVDPERAISILGQVGLGPEYLDRSASTLSGGEAQRVCLARTLLTEPDVLLADEPTSGLHLGSRLEFEDMTRRLTDLGLSVLWVTHDLDQLRRLAGHVLILLEGKIRFEGPPERLDGEVAVRPFLLGNADAGS